MSRRDLEGHLVALLFHTGFHVPEGAAVTAPWTAEIRDMLTCDPVPPGPLRRAQDVATVGVQLALGGGSPHRDDYGAVARRELARAPLAPAACVRDDERLLLGVAAGVGAAASDTASDLVSICRAREYTAPIRQVVVDLLAEALAEGAPRLTSSICRRAYRHLTTPSPGRPPVNDADRIAALWLATRLLDAVWEPTDLELAALDGIICDGHRTSALLLTAGRPFTPLDAAFVLDALSASPLRRIARRTTIEAVLAIVDAFPKSAAVLATRKRGRLGFAITDEYDVQDLFFALVLPTVSDIVEEDPAPKIAGKSSRLDFTSKTARLGFEIKHVKSTHHADTVREEILIDERTYQEHPYIDTVVVFVYDPASHIPLHERKAFEADLSKSITIEGRSIRYITRVG